MGTRSRVAGNAVRAWRECGFHWIRISVVPCVMPGVSGERSDCRGYSTVTDARAGAVPASRECLFLISQNYRPNDPYNGHSVSWSRLSVQMPSANVCTYGDLPAILTTRMSALRPVIGSIVKKVFDPASILAMTCSRVQRQPLVGLPRCVMCSCELALSCLFIQVTRTSAIQSPEQSLKS
jgi:hypothetical protein